jgi:hypothetical protein
MKTKPTLVKRVALETAGRIRAQKFNRVSKDFVDQVEAEIDCFLRKLYNEGEPEQFKTSGEKLFTPEAQERILVALNKRIEVIIHNRVKAHPSLGKTLKG